MLRQMESSHCHTQAISQFQNLFPAINMPNIKPGNSLNQILNVLVYFIFIGLNQSSTQANRQRSDTYNFKHEKHCGWTGT